MLPNARTCDVKFWAMVFALCEIKGLKNLEDELSKDLDAGRIQGVHDKLSQLSRVAAFLLSRSFFHSAFLKMGMAYAPHSPFV